MGVSPILSGAKAKLAALGEFRRGISALLGGESVTMAGVVGDAATLLAACLAEETGALILLLVANPGDVESVAGRVSLFSSVPILTYPVLPQPVVEADLRGSEIFLSEDRIFGERLRVLKELEKLALGVSSKGDALCGGEKIAALNSSTLSPQADLPDGRGGRNVMPLSGFLKKKSRVQKKTDRESESSPPEPLVLVTSLAAIRQPVPTRLEMNAASMFLRVGGSHPREDFVGWLVAGGFHRTPAVELPGEFSVRGDLLDIFPYDAETPVRIEYFGDEIESIRPFDSATQRSSGRLNSLVVTCWGGGSRGTGIFVDHLPNRTIPFVVEPDEIVLAATRLDAWSDSALKSKKTPTRSNFTAKNSVASIFNTLFRYPTAFVTGVVGGTDHAVLEVRFDFRSVERFLGTMETARRALDSTDGANVVIFSLTTGESRRMEDAFRGTEAGKQQKISYEIGGLAHGFQWPEFQTIFLSSAELVGRLPMRRGRLQTCGEVIDSFVDLAPGDLVIHVAHGLARFTGLTTITRGSQKEEHLALEFADRVALFVPASKIGLVQKYVGSGGKSPKLAKLHGKLWARQKKEVAAALFDMAMEMLELQAAREALEGTAFPSDSAWQRDFDESFPFDETDDQLTAIDAIKADMERTRPMDRLLCGDVGFGKTEVAIRAAFKAVDAGYQVAVLVPTTILAEQHYRVFSERMATFPLSIGVLSRFTDRKTELETLSRLRAGTLDLVIGTHRLVQKDIAFSRLGLVIIDEEQRFGVADKEHLKTLRSLVDVLTMTATPIPRTLHFSLLGLRDISNLKTPPLDRLPIETKVIRFDVDLIRRGVLNEIGRGGQIFFVHNRVRDIEAVAQKLRNIVPEARIEIGHAQMPDDELETVMRRFVSHQFDLLVCTTIIESGLDIPNANTIFIHRADRFGLAELHQLRGRVGRYRNQAYCYLLLDPAAPMTTDSVKRLRAIEEYSHLGAGFHLALRDLEIRGTGNILGTQQSGHIAIVGYEMYCEFLESAVRALKNEPQKIKIEVEIDLPGTTMIPDAYVADPRAKIDLYRRINRVTTREELADLADEMADRFGTHPLEVSRLLLCGEIRLAAWQHRFRSVQLSEGPGGLYVAMKFLMADRAVALKKQLEPRRIALRITDDGKAYIPVPKSLFTADGRPDPDHLLHYLLTALRVD